ncbi:hypothetical protein IW261DRAFT_1472670 [Armillaria novae-zelandiae]|uniref:Uncharacterized protein n=1 Tax=Armillaria novae-zelandiae TaxID=153914 RepID=A0AA39PCT7_9AGAR|nr:hypothetical protein IW261DRAFT_1472670 [Armillaria novae-zelandiae]
MPIYLPHSDMESIFRKAVMLTASFLMALVGFSLSLIASLLGIFFPDIQERPPRRQDPIHVSKGKRPRRHQVRDTLRSRDQHGLVTTVTEEPRPVFNILVQPINNAAHDSDGFIVAEPTEQGERGRSQALISDAPNLESPPPSQHSRASMSPSEYSERSEWSTQTYDFPTASSEELSPPRNSHVHGFRIGRAWKKSKNSLPSPTEEMIPKHPPPIKKSKTFTKRPSAEKKGICKARSFCVMEREKTPKVPSPRPRTQPYEAPYFTPLPGSGPVLSVPKAKPVRSSTLPPPSYRRAATIPPPFASVRTT